VNGQPTASSGSQSWPQGHLERAQTLKTATTFREFRARSPWLKRLRSQFHFLRKPVIFARSLSRTFERDSGWIRFPFYHYVFDDEREDFERQLRYLKSHGCFISFDDAISLLESTDPIDGRYFVLSFDDGFKNCFQNALPILLENKVPCTFFISVEYIGSCLTKFPNAFGYAAPVEFLTWDDCRRLQAAGMIIGSHALSHRSLIDLDFEKAFHELEDSKRQIECQLGCACNHFAAPRGKPGIHFSVERDPEIAGQVGYRSFATAQPGAMRRGQSPFSLKRISVHPGLDNLELRHSLLSVD
jgi:hypothetical protein